MEPIYKKYVAFLHINNIHVKKDMMDIIPLTRASTAIKYPGINPTKKVKDLCNEKFKSVNNF